MATAQITKGEAQERGASHPGHAQPGIVRSRMALSSGLTARTFLALKPRVGVHMSALLNTELGPGVGVGAGT